MGEGSSFGDTLRGPGGCRVDLSTCGGALPRWTTGAPLATRFARDTALIISTYGGALPFAVPGAGSTAPSPALRAASPRGRGGCVRHPRTVGRFSVGALGTLPGATGMELGLHAGVLRRGRLGMERFTLLRNAKCRFGKGAGQVEVRPGSMARMRSRARRSAGTGTDLRSARATMSPKTASTSSGRPANRSCGMDA